MNAINRNDLKARLLDEGYQNDSNFEKTIDRLMKLKGEPNEMLGNWMESGVISPFAPIEGIDISFLKGKLGMKDPAIIIAYAMLLDNPGSNSAFFKKLANDRVIYEPTK